MVFTDKGLKAIRDEVNSLHDTSFSVDDIESPSQELLQKWLDWYKDHNLWEDGEKPQGRFEALLDKYDDLLSRFGE